MPPAALQVEPMPRKAADAGYRNPAKIVWSGVQLLSKLVCVSLFGLDPMNDEARRIEPDEIEGMVDGYDRGAVRGRWRHSRRDRPMAAVDRRGAPASVGASTARRVVWIR